MYSRKTVAPMSSPSLLASPASGTNFSPTAWESVLIAELLLNEMTPWAAARLRDSGDGIAQIALEAGFFDQSHFTRAFKQHFGATPLAYRRDAHR